MRSFVILLVIFGAFLLVPQSPAAPSPVAGAWQVNPSNCSSTTGVSQIIITPNTLTLTSDQTVTFQAALRKSNGQAMAGDVIWSASSGRMELTSGLFDPDSTGMVTIAACAGTTFATVSVRVLQGATVDLTMWGDRTIMTADDTLTLTVTAEDEAGNLQNVLIPTSDWVRPGGWTVSASGEQHQLRPKESGDWILEVSVLSGLITAQWNVTVMPGMVTGLIGYASDYDITSDEASILTMEFHDAHGNRWSVDGEWAVTDPPPGASIQVIRAGIEPGTAIFEGSVAGLWTLEAEHQGEDYEIQIEVRPGQLHTVELLGDGAHMSVDDSLSLSPMFRDVAGNQVTPMSVIWLVDGVDVTDDLVSSNYNLSQTSAGVHTIVLSADGRVAIVRYEVTPGRCADIITTTEIDVVMVSGTQFGFGTRCVDGHGNSFPVDADLSYPLDTLLITSDEAGGLGYYFVEAVRVGSHELVLTVDGRSEPHFIDVSMGGIDTMTVDVAEDIDQGERFSLVVTGNDAGGNLVGLVEGDVRITTKIGDVSGPDDDGLYWIAAQREGLQQYVLVEVGNVSELVYIDVRPNLLEGRFGSSEEVMIGGIGLNTLFMMTALMGLYVATRRPPVVEDDDDMMYDEHGYDPYGSSTSSDSPYDSIQQSSDGGIGAYSPPIQVSPPSSPYATVKPPSFPTPVFPPAVASFPPPSTATIPPPSSIMPPSLPSSPPPSPSPSSTQVPSPVGTHVPQPQIVADSGPKDASGNRLPPAQGTTPGRAGWYVEGDSKVGYYSEIAGRWTRHQDA